MKKLPLIVSFFIFFLFPKSINAQVVINEIYSPTTNNDWVEVYYLTTGTGSIDLTEYRLEDRASNKKVLTGTLSPGEFETFDWFNRLNHDGDTVKLVRISDEHVLQEVVYGEGGICAPESGQSVGRIPDGTGGFIRLSTPTKTFANNPDEVPCPTPTPTPTPSPTESPTEAPTSAPVQTTTSSPTPKPTVLAKKTSRPKPRTVLGDDDENNEDLIVSMREELNGSEEEENSDNEEKKNKNSLVAILIIICGVGLVGVAGYSFYVQKKKTEIETL